MLAGGVPGEPLGSREGLDPQPAWLALLGRSERGGRDYAPDVEGEIPAELQGRLYRNGPGLFERRGARSSHLLDGDGLVQCLALGPAGAHYRSEFVRTEKWQRESAAGRRLYSSWTTRRPGGFARNLGGGPILSQAGVTVVCVNGRLLARDEVGPSYELDPQDLSTLRAHPLGPGLERFGVKAHSKFDPGTGEWFLAGQRFGASMELRVSVRGADLKERSRLALRFPRNLYLHDFLLSRQSVVFVLHPCQLRAAPFLCGLRSFTQSLRWRPAEGNHVAVLPRDGGEPFLVQAPSAFMWHGLNAFEDGRTLVVDFVGYDEPDHFIGPSALFETLMVGRRGWADCPGTIRRYRIDLGTRVLREEILDRGHHEFPMLDGRAAMRAQRCGYFATGAPGGVHTGLKRLDYQSGASGEFQFGPDVQVGEPVFAPRPGGELDEGWLIAQCLDGPAERSFFALFRAEKLEEGPLARIWLSHSVPLSFHGTWEPAVAGA